ncbi:hypothetical protein QQ045_019035 [Rhodiola kirilowii]
MLYHLQTFLLLIELPGQQTNPEKFIIKINPAHTCRGCSKGLHACMRYISSSLNRDTALALLAISKSDLNLERLELTLLDYSMNTRTIKSMSTSRGRGDRGGGRGGAGGRGRGGFSGGRGGDALSSRGRGRGGGGRGGARGRGGGRGGGMKGGSKVVVEPHRHEGVFVAKGKEDALVTKNMVPGEAVYNEKRISVQNEDGTKTEYRVWNPFRSKLAAAILGGVDNIWIVSFLVHYVFSASGTTVSHVSEVVGPTGVVYAVEFSHRSGRDLVNMAKKRTNVIPIIEDARHPAKYRMLVGMVDVIFSDVAQPDQARILALNASYFLKNGGHFVISIKANCIDSTVPAEAVFTQEVNKLKADQFKPAEQVTLEPFERDHACVVGGYWMPKRH